MGHYKNKHRNTTRSSNTSHSSHHTNTSTSSSTGNSTIEDDFSSIIPKSKPSSRNTTPKNNKIELEKEEEIAPEPEPEPEKPRLPEWEEMGMTEEEYWAMRRRTADLMRQEQLENYRNYMLNQYDSVSYWKERMERLERMRDPYNKARGWSAITVSSVEYIDKQIEECKKEIQYLESLE